MKDGLLSLTSTTMLFSGEPKSKFVVIGILKIKVVQH